MWSDGQYQADYVAEVEGLRAIRENQTANIQPLADRSKNYEVKVTWLDSSAIAPSNLGNSGGNNCDLDEPEIDAKATVYEIDNFWKDGFSVNEDEVKDSIYSVEELMARGMVDALNRLDEKVSVVSVGIADTYSGKNLYPLQYTYNAVTGQTEVPAAEYTKPEFFAYLRQTTIMNRMRNTYIIDSGTLYQDQLIADANSANSDGKGAARLYQSFKIYQDMLGMVQANLTSDLLLINKGALAFGHKTKYTAAPTEYGGKVNQTRWSVASPNLPGVRYDAYYSLKCVAPKTAGAKGTAGEETILHTWRFIARFGLWLNPVGFKEGNTGVLSVNKV